MDKFEEIGRRLDEEVTRLFQYIEEEGARNGAPHRVFFTDCVGQTHGSCREVGGSPEIKTWPTWMECNCYQLGSLLDFAKAGALHSCGFQMI